MVAASKLRRAQDNIVKMRPYAKKLGALLQNLSAQQEEGQDNNFAEIRPIEKVLIIVITSDKGLCGAFNSNVFKELSRHITENYQEQFNKGNVVVMPIGKKALDYFKKHEYQMVSDYWNMFSPVDFEKSKEASEYVMKEFLAHTYDRIDIVYNEFRNVATQILQREQYLPVKPVEVTSDKTFEVDYIYQPSKEDIVEELIPKSLKIQLYKAILDSNAAEHGARMTAMDQATDNAGELIKELKLKYNRTRQAAITKEILEIVAGAEAMK